MWGVGRDGGGGRRALDTGLGSLCQNMTGGEGGAVSRHGGWEGMRFQSHLAKESWLTM